MNEIIVDQDAAVLFKCCKRDVDTTLAKALSFTHQVDTNEAVNPVLITCDFALTIAMLDVAPDFLKADHGAIPADARWITVHPNGAGSKGQPVLVVPAGKDGAFRVIGGAGGKLNMLKLRGVKSEDHYKQEASERAAAKRNARKDQIVTDKALGIHDAKEQARKGINDQRRKAQEKFIHDLAESMGWDKAALDLNVSELSPEGG